MSQNVKEYGVQILPRASSYLTADAPLDAASGAEDATAANGSSVTLQYAPAAAQPDGPLTDPTGLPKDIAVLSSAYQSNFASSGITEQQYAYSPTGTDITFSGPAGITGNATPFTGSSWTPDNNDAAFVQDNGSISKQLTNLQPGGWYAVTFAATGRPGFAQQTIQVTMDGTVLGTFSPGQSPNYQGYVTQAFYATSGTHTLTIQGLDPNGTDQTALIDNLQVVQVAPQFQDPSFSKSTVNALSFQYQPTLNDGWTFVGGAGVSGSDSGFTGANPLQSVNERILFLQGAAQASQSIDGFQTNTAYTVTFDAAARANFGSQVLEVDVDGQSVGTFKLAATSYTRFTTNAFMPGSGQHAVTFRTLNGNDVTALVRGVSLNTLDPTLQNTSFAGTLPASGYAYAPSADAVSGWNFVGGAGVTANGTAFTGGNPASPDGANVAFLQGNGATISQQVYGFQQRVPYQLTFSAAQRASNTEAISVQLLVDGNVASTFTPPLDGAYHTYTLQGSVAPGTHTIALRSLDPDGTDQTIFIDAPTLTPQMGQALYGEDTAGTMTALDVVQGTLSAGAPDVYDNNGNVLDPSQLTGLFDGAGNLLGASGVDPTDGRTYVWNFSTQQKTDITDYGITSTAGWLDLSQQAVQDETPQHSISIPDPFGGLFDPQQVEAGWDQATQDEIASIVAEYQYAYEQQQAGATPSPLPGTSPIIPPPFSDDVDGAPGAYDYSATAAPQYGPFSTAQYLGQNMTVQQGSLTEAVALFAGTSRGAEVLADIEHGPYSVDISGGVIPPDPQSYTNAVAGTTGLAGNEIQIMMDMRGDLNPTNEDIFNGVAHELFHADHAEQDLGLTTYLGTVSASSAGIGTAQGPALNLEELRTYVEQYNYATTTGFTTGGGYFIPGVGAASYKQFGAWYTAHQAQIANGLARAAYQYGLGR